MKLERPSAYLNRFETKLRSKFEPIKAQERPLDQVAEDAVWTHYKSLLNRHFMSGMVKIPAGILATSELFLWGKPGFALVAAGATALTARGAYRNIQEMRRWSGEHTYVVDARKKRGEVVYDAENPQMSTVDVTPKQQ